jgi:vacuolar-type H+-ATPase subunit I/STV1
LYEEQVQKLKMDNQRLERANVDKNKQLADATSSEEVVGLRARVVALEKERAETLQEKALLEQKHLDQAPMSFQMEVVPNQSIDNEERFKDLEKRLGDLSDSKHRLQVERDYLSDMLKEAREIAGRAEASKAELMSSARIMRETLQTAPKAAEALYAARVSAAEGEAERLRAQVQLLLEQNRLSQADEIRRKAARYSVVELKLREMEGERLTLLKEVLDGEEEREKLSRELRGIKQEYGLAIHRDAEDQTEEHYGLVISDAGVSDSSSEVTSQTPTPTEPPSNPWAGPVLVDTGSQRMVYVCQWQIEDDSAMCGQIFDRREVSCLVFIS